MGFGACFIRLSHLFRDVDEGVRGQLGEGAQGDDHEVLRRVRRQHLHARRPHRRGRLRVVMHVLKVIKKFENSIETSPKPHLH